MNRLAGKKIAFLGYGLENQALLTWLKKQKLATTYTILDPHPAPAKLPTKVTWQSGQNYLKNLNSFDVVFRSPGAPLFLPEIKEAAKKGVSITSAMNLFLELAPTKNIIGVTGSKGKGTTASLIAAILKADGRKVFLGGNIGVAPFSFFEKLTAASWIVLELSSFQLEDFRSSPRYSLLTNLFKEHLEPADPNNPNYHKSFASYVEAKLNIARHPENKYFWIPKKLKTKLNSKKINGQFRFFEASNYPSLLAGDFNKENVGAAFALTNYLRVPKKTIKKAVATFQGLPHRLELVAVKKGIAYYDNSFSTTPESTIADLESFPGAVIILGGADKGADFKALAKKVKSQAHFVILLKGTASPRLKKDLLKAGLSAQKIKEAKSMAEAVFFARAAAPTKGVVLLSTACASFGLFKNYKERGDLFQKYVRAQR
ncbi:UDP-N-acetylmuramoyl-L-alanine--D-glutamate ligase [Candidatus Falkowbacteria bacterium]|jgi:UDP-N-acetylmuramoylalanine--D-glutamate ligase|nr:UDP-N-acetylmuramoyl-L-alanine--D-glutamate ligase [Patescibacteria group bacterium]MDD4466277.1 UDP-N-acetylmuramoyl-L-alanine--D-glutamate ligase [Patescibacteria group bacterium]NCU43220.1 UDP-N-acetylmuramoyl-L-alanine--D-glutamate ligase [Candidatus Falkowbacteria bacterium]